ncbi:MAG: ATP-binding protein [Legionellaceae bacterium]|nr:ATP-binding protein [Legionellaceae bacterium]
MMPRKFLQRFLPHADKIKKNKYLRIFGKYLHAADLWHLHRHSVAKAVSIGFFCMFMPMPLQMVLAAAIAIVWRANVLISAVTVWISNPLTMGPMFYFAYKIGGFVFDTTPIPYEQHHKLLENFQYVWKPLILGCLTCGTIAAVTGYFGVNLLWRWIITKKWAFRQKTRRHRNKPK